MLQGFSQLQQKRKKEKKKRRIKSFADIFPTDKNHKMHVKTDELKVNTNVTAVQCAPCMNKTV